MNKKNETKKGIFLLLLSAFLYSIMPVLIRLLGNNGIPLLMVFGSIAAILGLIFPFLGQLFLYPILPFLVYFQSVVSYFGQSNLVLHTGLLPPEVWIGYYLLLVAWVSFRKKKVTLRTDARLY